MSNRLLLWYLHKFFLKIFIRHKSTGFWKNRNEVIIFQHDVIAEEMRRCFCCVDDISLWLKFGSRSFHRTTVIQKYVLWGFDQKNVYLKRSLPSVWTYNLNLGQAATPKVCPPNLSNRWPRKLKKFQDYSMNT